MDRRDAAVWLPLPLQATELAAGAYRSCAGAADLHPVRRSPTRLGRHQWAAQRCWAAHQSRAAVDPQPRPRHAAQPHLHRATPFNGQQHQASHEPIIDPELFQRAQLLLAERSDSPRAQAANATDYLLTSFLRCQRCGHGFVGTAAHGNGGVYRYYTCFSRQRHGTARCDQQRLPAGPLEEAIVAEVLAALDDGSIFQDAARRAQLAWHAQHPGRQVELAGVRAILAERRAAIDRYLRAFEAQRLPESTCADRLTALQHEVQGLEAHAAALEVECDTAPTMATDHLLAGIQGSIQRAVVEGAPEQLKQVLDAVVDRILVESRACIQPYFVAPTVRTRPGRRRGTGIEPA